MIDRQLLDITEYTDEGYLPLIAYGAWRVAILNYIDELLPHNIGKLQRHDNTDEIFVLLKGRCLLFVAEGLDPERPLSEQSDSFWWGGTGFARLDRPYGSFARVVRGHDRSRGGPAKGPFSATIDAGCGFGGPLMAVCFLPSGDADDVIEA
jgi:hypothetical protein